MRATALGLGVFSPLPHLWSHIPVCARASASTRSLSPAEGRSLPPRPGGGGLPEDTTPTPLRQVCIPHPLNPPPRRVSELDGGAEGYGSLAGGARGGGGVGGEKVGNGGSLVLSKGVERREIASLVLP